MPDYKKMYAILCGAIDDVIDPLEEIPLAVPSAKKLRNALEEAEKLYIATSLGLSDSSMGEPFLPASYGGGNCGKSAWMDGKRVIAGRRREKP